MDCMTCTSFHNVIQGIQTSQTYSLTVLDEHWMPTPPSCGLHHSLCWKCSALSSSSPPHCLFAFSDIPTPNSDILHLYHRPLDFVLEAQNDSSTVFPTEDRHHLIQYWYFPIRGQPLSSLCIARLDNPRIERFAF